MKKRFPKKHLDYPQQIELLEQRNLKFSDFSFAIKKLKNLNYYRLTPYFYPFFAQKDLFKSDTYFEQIIEIYEFDQALRNLMFKHIESIEVYIRAKLSFAISKTVGALGYLDYQMFNLKHQNKHSKLLAEINKDILRSKEVFVSKYLNEVGYLPIWAVVEVISMGSLSMLYSYSEDRIRKEVANELNVSTFVLQSWLHTLTYVRNICAHHSRLWNRELAIEPVIPRRDNIFSVIPNKKIFFTVMICHRLINAYDPSQNTIAKDLAQLIKKHPNINLEAMGIPPNWQYTIR